MCTATKVEIEKHFILECEAFKDNRDRYTNVLTNKSWDDLFNEGTVEKLGALIIKLNKQKIYINSMRVDLSHRLFLTSQTLKYFLPS